MRANTTGLLNPIKMKHSNSFIFPEVGYTGNYNKNYEKISIIEFDLEKIKDTTIKLRSELLKKNKEINDLKANRADKNKEYLYTLKVIETVLQLVDANSSSQKSKNEHNTENNKKPDNIDNPNENNDENNNNKENKNQLKEDNDKDNEDNFNSNGSNKKLPPVTTHMEQSPSRANRQTKEILYINSLKLQIEELKELLDKKDEEIKELLKNKTSINFSKLQNNFEKHYNELSNIKKQNELIKTKIEDISNLIFVEKEGNKNLKSKLQVFQSTFKEFQENSDKKKTDLVAKLFQARDRERECRIFHTKKTNMGSRKSSRVNINNSEIDDNERLIIAEEEIKNIKKDIESTNKDIINKNNENDLLKTNRTELGKKVNELNERNDKLKNEINDLNKKIKDLKNTKSNLEKEQKEIKNKMNNSNNNLRKEKNKITEIKDNLNKKENQIIELKKQIEKLKSNNIFKNGMFLTKIGGDNEKIKKDNNEEIDDVNIDEEMAQIEKKYKMINEQNKLLEDKNKEKVKNSNIEENNEKDN